MKIEAAFVTSAAAAADFPADRLPEIAFVGRSNVGKSSLINALVRRRIARTSATPGKTRLANIYRVDRGTADPVYLVDLPGYGYARGGADSAHEFHELTQAFFGRAEQAGRTRQGGEDSPAQPGPPSQLAAILLVDARHPGLDSDRAAWRWLERTAEGVAIAATKIDKLARGERIRAFRELESVFEHSVLPVSAVTGEGLEELWKLIDKLATNPNPNRRSRRPSPPRPATAPRLPKN